MNNIKRERELREREKISQLLNGKTMFDLMCLCGSPLRLLKTGGSFKMIPFINAVNC